jgi:type I restriction enzyme S subunit
LEAELEAELEARKKQYMHYRDSLLQFEDNNVEWKTLGEIGQFIRGNGLQKKDFTESGVGCIHYGQIYTYYGTHARKTKSFVSQELSKKLKKVEKGDLIITNTSENIEDVCKAVAWLGDNQIVTGGHATIFKHEQNPKYLAYYTQTDMFSIEKKRLAQGTKVIDVSAKNLAKIKIPIPSLKEQERIASILDKLDSLVNDISIGLPAEIKARRKQYEHYRNRLLTFEPLKT